ncbi:hypothetical protein GCM10020219_057570 [Nonomuraea dietziae]
MSKPRARRRLTIAALVVMAAGTATITPAHAAVACGVDYTMNDWGGGFTANVKITNLGDPLTAWKLGFGFPGTQKISQGWSATWNQSGANVTADSLSWNGNLGTGQSTTIGFNATYTGPNAKPSAFTVNGTACTGANQAPTVKVTSPSAGATFTAPATVAIAAEAGDADGSVAKVEFFQGSTKLGEDTTAPYAYSWADVAVGEYSLTARATDDKGAITTSAPVGISVKADSAPAVVATPSGVTVPEGGEASYEVKLSKQPAAGVTVATSRTSGDADLTVKSGASLTFTTSNWSTGAEGDDRRRRGRRPDLEQRRVHLHATGHGAAKVTASEADNDLGGDNEYTKRFIELYNDLKDPANGYFSPEGVPYHSVETLLVEAPDHGHETTSEAYSYYLWLEAAYGKATGNWAPFNDAWASMEKYITPRDGRPADQLLLQRRQARHLRRRMGRHRAVPVEAGTPASASARTPSPPSSRPPTAPATSTACTGCSTSTTPTASAAAATARPSPPTSTPTSVAPRSRSSRRSPSRAATPSSTAARTASSTCSRATQATPSSGSTPTPPTPTPAPSRWPTGRTPGPRSRARSRRSPPR